MMAHCTFILGTEGTVGEFECDEKKSRCVLLCCFQGYKCSDRPEHAQPNPGLHCIFSK